MQTIWYQGYKPQFSFFKVTIKFNRFSLRVRSWQSSHASHLIQDLSFPRLFLVRRLVLSDSDQWEIQRKSRKGRLTSSPNRWCAYNSEVRWKQKPPSALGYLSTANFRNLRVFPLRVLASCLPQQILNFPSNLFTYFDEKAEEFT